MDSISVPLLDNPDAECTNVITSLYALPPEATTWHIQMICIASKIPGGIILNIPESDGNNGGNPRYYLVQSLTSVEPPKDI